MPKIQEPKGLNSSESFILSIAIIVNGVDNTPLGLLGDVDEDRTARGAVHYRGRGLRI